MENEILTEVIEAIQDKEICILNLSKRSISDELLIKITEVIQSQGIAASNVVINLVDNHITSKSSTTFLTAIAEYINAYKKPIALTVDLTGNSIDKTGIDYMHVAMYTMRNKVSQGTITFNGKHVLCKSGEVNTIPNNPVNSLGAQLSDPDSPEQIKRTNSNLLIHEEKKVPGNDITYNNNDAIKSTVRNTDIVDNTEKKEYSPSKTSEPHKSSLRNSDFINKMHSYIQFTNLVLNAAQTSITVFRAAFLPSEANKVALVSKIIQNSGFTLTMLGYNIGLYLPFIGVGLEIAYNYRSNYTVGDAISLLVTPVTMLSLSPSLKAKFNSNAPTTAKAFAITIEGLLTILHGCTVLKDWQKLWQEWNSRDTLKEEIAKEPDMFNDFYDGVSSYASSFLGAVEAPHQDEL